MQGRAVQFSHIPKQCRTGAVMQEAFSCDTALHRLTSTGWCKWGTGQVSGMLLGSCRLLALI